MSKIRIRLRVVHRTSISTFEVAHDNIVLDDNGNYLSLSSKDKPWIMHQTIVNNPKVKTSVQDVLDQLLDAGCEEEPFEKAFSEGLIDVFKEWVRAKGIRDPRFLVPDPA